MALDTYANLKLEIISWSKRDDIDLKVDDFIDLAESEMYANDVEPLQLRGEETLVAFSTSISDRFVALPTGYQSMRKVRIQIANGESVDIKFRTPSQLEIRSDAGLPRFFTVTDQIEMDQVSDIVYSGEFQYFQEFTALSSSNTTNIVLTNHPTIYLFGAMWALRAYTDEEIEAEIMYTRFIKAIRGANNKNSLGRYGPAPVMRVEGYIP